MEENDDIIYDLESMPEAGSQEGAVSSEKSENSDISGKPDISPDISELSEASEKPAGSEQPETLDKSEKSETPDISEGPESSVSPDNPDPARAEIDRMLAEMGSETLLNIIRDNRNAAISQIISEAEAARDSAIQSGISTSMTCRSIFDLAAMA